MTLSPNRSIDLHNVGLNTMHVSDSNWSKWQMKFAPLLDTVIRRNPIRAANANQAFFKKGQPSKHFLSPYCVFFARIVRWVIEISNARTYSADLKAPFRGKILRNISILAVIK